MIAQNTAVFFAPITPPITSMFGSERAGVVLEPFLEHPGENREQRRGQVPFYRVQGVPQADGSFFGLCEGRENEKEHHCEHEKAVLGKAPALIPLIRQSQIACGSRGIVFPEYKCHKKPGHHRENHRSHRPRKTQLPAEDAGREHDREHIDGRAGIEKSRCRSDSGAPR